MRTQFATSWEALRWALAFHGRHVLIVSALMVLPGIQRFMIMSWELPGPVATLSEILVLAARIGLVVYVISKVGPAPHAWASTRMFFRERWPSLLITLGLLAVAFAVFDLALEGLSDGDTYRSVLFAVKNLTVIPFTVIWMISVARTCVQYDLVKAAAASR
jgi:hypothetical protein